MFKLRRKYYINNRTTRWPKRFVITGLTVLISVILGMVAVRYFYNINLGPVSSSAETQTVIVEQGATVPEIGDELQEKKLIRSSMVFQLYIRSKGDKNPLIAGTYRLQPNLSTPQVVSILSHGQVATDLVTILPGQRIDQIRESLIKQGFSEAAVDKALNPTTYTNHPALVDKPPTVSLEGYLYPESFQKTASTTPQEIITESLNQMHKRLTPDLRSDFAAHGLSVYQGIILASIVESEAYKQQDRNQIAQVFLVRLKMGMKLESDPTAKYGAILAGRNPSITFESAYNTYLHAGLPPTPISNVSESSLKAVAYPANSDWLFFVAGDDGTVHFSKTLEEHEKLTEQYCSKLCGN